MHMRCHVLEVWKKFAVYETPLILKGVCTRSLRQNSQQICPHYKWRVMERERRDSHTKQKGG